MEAQIAQLTSPTALRAAWRRALSNWFPSARSRSFACARLRIQPLARGRPAGERLPSRLPRIRPQAAAGLRPRDRLSILSTARRAFLRSVRSHPPTRRHDPHRQNPRPDRPAASGGGVQRVFVPADLSSGDQEARCTPRSPTRSRSFKVIDSGAARIDPGHSRRNPGGRPPVVPGHRGRQPVQRRLHPAGRAPFGRRAGSG